MRRRRCFGSPARRGDRCGARPSKLAVRRVLCVAWRRHALPIHVWHPEWPLHAFSFDASRVYGGVGEKMRARAFFHAGDFLGTCLISMECRWPPIERTLNRRSTGMRMRWSGCRGGVYLDWPLKCRFCVTSIDATAETVDVNLAANFESRPRE